MERITRREAHDKNLRRFYTGPCIHGHNSERYVTSGACIQCVTFRGPPRTKIHHGPGSNMHYPAKPVEFRVGISDKLAHAAFLYAEANGWLNAAADAVVKTHPHLALPDPQVVPEKYRADVYRPTPAVTSQQPTLLPEDNIYAGHRRDPNAPD